MGIEWATQGPISSFHSYTHLFIHSIITAYLFPIRGRGGEEAGQEAGSGLLSKCFKIFLESINLSYLVGMTSGNEKK